MNRQTIPPQTNPPYTNGHYETPQAVSGVSLHPTAHQPTTFLPDLPLRGRGPLAYALQRFELGGTPVARYLSALWLLIAVLAYFRVVPGHWFTVGVALLLWVAQLVIGIRQQRDHFVSFTPQPVPALNEQPLATSEKLAIYATGLMSVEGRYRHYSALPGFYRTFATGEHAVLCRVLPRKWLAISTWPAGETGMWYAFINPTEIEQVTWGNLRFGPTLFPAVQIAYRLEVPAGSRRKQPDLRQEQLILATPRVEDARRLYVDLLANVPSGKIVKESSTPH